MVPRLAARATLLACAALAVPACARDTRCALCKMVVPAETRTFAVVDGQRHVICDPRCALTEEYQTEHAVRLLQVTDFNTRAPLDPSKAYYVNGSDTAPDAHEGGMRTWPGGQASLEWHRCLPSILAFATGEAAARHARMHGGRVVTYAELGFADSGTR